MNSNAAELVREDVAGVLDGQSSMLSGLKGETLVITGGTGFIGTWLCEMIACLNDQYGFGIKPVIVARGAQAFRTRYPHLGRRTEFTWIDSDVRNRLEFPRETSWLIHAAANPDHRFHSSSPVEAMSIIAEGTSAVMREAGRCSHFKMALNLSSSLIYGAQPLELNQMPETFRGAPTCGASSSAYAEAKRYAETLCSAIRSQSRIPILTVRPFAFLGPYQSIDTPWAINNFIRDAIQGGPIRVMGDGQTIRSYLYGADAAFWLLRILTAGTEGETYNLGSDQEISLEKLATLVAQNFNPRPEIKLRTLSDATHRSRMVPDVSLARQKLGLINKTPLEKAIQRTTQWNQMTWRQ